MHVVFVDERRREFSRLDYCPRLRERAGLSEVVIAPRPLNNVRALNASVDMGMLSSYPPPYLIVPVFSLVVGV